MADDTEKPLVQKLGIEEGMTVSILNSPNYFHIDLGDLPDDVEVHRDADDESADLFLIFSSRSAEAERGLHRAMTLLPADGGDLGGLAKGVVRPASRHRREHLERPLPAQRHGGRRSVLDRRDLVGRQIRRPEGEPGRLAVGGRNYRLNL